MAEATDRTNPVLKAIIAAEVMTATAKTQAFFAELAESLTPPHTDDRYKKSIQDLLLRAQERGIYSPVGS